MVNSFLLCAIQIFAGGRLANKDITAIVLISLFSLFELILIVALTQQPKNKKSLYFEVTTHASVGPACRSHVVGATRTLCTYPERDHEHLFNPQTVASHMDSICRLDGRR